jgi:hypothetical protein
MASSWETGLPPFLSKIYNKKLSQIVGPLIPSKEYRDCFCAQKAQIRIFEGDACSRTGSFQDERKKRNGVLI